jgi:hypothetical protein
MMMMQTMKRQMSSSYREVEDQVARRVFSWGTLGGDAPLGRMTRDAGKGQAIVELESLRNRRFVSLSAGWKTSFAVEQVNAKKHSALWSWGLNVNGSLMHKFALGSSGMLISFYDDFIIKFDH